MNPLAELDPLHLDPAAKTQVAALLKQAQGNVAEQLQAKDAEISGKISKSRR